MMFLSTQHDQWNKLSNPSKHQNIIQTKHIREKKIPTILYFFSSLCQVSVCQTTKMYAFCKNAKKCLFVDVYMYMYVWDRQYIACSTWVRVLQSRNVDVRCVSHSSSTVWIPLYKMPHKIIKCPPFFTIDNYRELKLTDQFHGFRMVQTLI